jgi:hypothetical protein
MKQTTPAWLLHAARHACAALLIVAASHAQAWSGHALCTWQALAVVPEVTRAKVRAEPLENFVRAEAAKLEALLREQDVWARANVPHYPPLTATLEFKSTPPLSGELMTPRLLRALRMNPQSHLSLYLQVMPGTLRDAAIPVPWNEITTLKSGSGARSNNYVRLQEGDTVAALEVVATASAEPDYGLDIGLFADNGTDYGATYGFGKQPFGSPSVDYSSQAPFHMAFMHESAIVNAAAPFLQRTWPDLRIAQYMALARLAFATGHDYWGWRFTGWALHYVQDMTQPYHARVLPGRSTMGMLWINTLDMAGFGGAKANAITLVTNRHIVLENYQFRRISQAFERAKDDDALFTALRDTSRDSDHLVFAPESTRRIVSLEAAKQADLLDAQISRSFAEKYVSDAKQPLGDDSGALDMLAVALAAPGAEVVAFDAQLAALMARYGRHSRALVRAVIVPAR